MNVFVKSMFLVLAFVIASPAFAHESNLISDGFISGFTHPIFGWDHVVAMVAVGLWGAILGAPAIWALPIAFPLVMSFGAAWGILGATIPFVETGIALSGVVLGLLVALMIKAPMIFAAMVVTLFAVFHGYAHGIEFPETANSVVYGAGFVIATGLLHLIGILFGNLLRFELGKMLVRVGGVLISLTGLTFLLGYA